MGAACSRAVRVAARACRLDLFSGCQFAETLPLLLEAVRHCPYAGTRNIRSRADYIGAHFHRGGGDRDRGIRDCRYRAAARQAGEQCGGNCNMKSTQIRGNQRQPPCPAARPPPASMAWKLLAPGGARPEDLQGVTRTYKCSQRLREACCSALDELRQVRLPYRLHVADAVAVNHQVCAGDGLWSGVRDFHAAVGGRNYVLLLGGTACQRRDECCHEQS